MSIEENKAEIGTPVCCYERRAKYRDSEFYYCMPSPPLEVDILFRF